MAHGLQRGWLVVVGLAAAAPAFGGGSAIGGSVVDRNGVPLGRVMVKLATPDAGEVEVVTDPNGLWRVEYLRDEQGEHIKLGKKTTYTLELFKVGYHLQSMPVEYKRGALDLPEVRLVPDSIAMGEKDHDNLDASIAGTSGGGETDTKEGQ